MYSHSYDDIGIVEHLNSMGSAGSHDFDTILAEYPDINKLYELVLINIENIAKQGTYSEKNTRNVKNAIQRLLQNVSAIKIAPEPETSVFVNDDINDNIKNESESLYEIRDQLIQANKLQRRKADGEKDSLSIMNENLNNKLREASLELQIKHNLIQKLEEQLNDSSKDALNLSKEAKMLQEKCETKSIKIKSYKSENKRLKNELDGIKLKMMESDVLRSDAPTDEELQKIIDEQKNEISELKETIKELNKISEAQSEKIITVSNTKKELDATNKEMSNKMESTITENEKMKKQLKEISAKNKKLEEENIKLLRENTAFKTTRKQESAKLGKLEAITHKIEKVIKKKNNIELEEMPKFIKGLLKKKSDEDYIEENNKLRALIDSLTSFIEKPESVLLDVKTPLIENKDIRTKMEMRINAVKTLIKVDKDKAIEYDRILGNEHVVEKELNRIAGKDSLEEYALVFALSNINERLRNSLINKEKLLKPLMRMMPPSYSDKDVFVAVSEFFGKLEAIIEDLSYSVNSLIKFRNKKENRVSIDLLNDYVKDSTKTFKEILRIIRPETSFCGSLDEIPQILNIYITSLTRELKRTREISESKDMEMSRSIRSTTVTNDKIEDAVNSVKKKYENRINELKEKLNTALGDIDDYKSKIDDEVNEKRELETTINNLMMKKDDSDAALITLKHDNIRLRQLLKEKTEQAKNRIEEAIATSEEHHEKELNRIKSKNEEQLSTLNLQLQLKTKKLDKVKQQSKEMQEVLQKSIETQRESIKTLINQNKEISQKLERSTVSNIYDLKIKSLEQKLQEERTEKYKLVLQINEMDSYKDLVSKISKKLQESGVKEPESGWTTDNIVKEINRVAEAVRIQNLSSSTLTRTKTMIATIEQWKDWAKSTISCIDKSINAEEVSDEQLRTIIRDAAKVNTEKSKSVELMQSLRAQKSLLKSNFAENLNERSTDKSGKPTIGCIASVVLFITFAKRKAEVTNACKLLEMVK